MSVETNLLFACEYAQRLAESLRNANAADQFKDKPRMTILLPAIEREAEAFLKKVQETEELYRTLDDKPFQA